MKVEDTVPRVFVVILNWNLKDDTIACVESLLASSITPTEIVVVDNGSEDGSVAALQTTFGTRITLLTNAMNLGFAAGNNVGVRYALEQQADWIMLLNNDTTIAAETLACLLSAAIALPDAGLLAPAIFYHDQPTTLWRFGDRHMFGLPIPHKVGARELARPLIPVDYLTGCALLVRRAVWEKIGLLDEIFFMYYEDADFCRRAKMAGFRAYVITSAQVWHKAGQSSRKVKPLTRYRTAKSKLTFYRRYGRRLDWLLLGPYLLFDTARVLLTDLLHGNWTQALAYLRGALDGWRSKGAQPSC